MRRTMTLSTVLILLSGLLDAALGAMVIVGWHTHQTVLLQIHPHWIAMVYNTALSFLLCAVSLVWLVLGYPRLATACGGMIAVVGILGMIQHLFHVDLGIDQLLMT